MYFVVPYPPTYTPVRQAIWYCLHTRPREGFYFTTSKSNAVCSVGNTHTYHHWSSCCWSGRNPFLSSQTQYFPQQVRENTSTQTHKKIRKPRNQLGGGTPLKVNLSAGLGLWGERFGHRFVFGGCTIEQLFSECWWLVLIVYSLVWS